jgi:hypothetical protein
MVFADLDRDGFLESDTLVSRSSPVHCRQLVFLLWPRARLDHSSSGTTLSARDTCPFHSRCFLRLKDLIRRLLFLECMRGMRGSPARPDTQATGRKWNRTIMLIRQNARHGLNGCHFATVGRLSAVCVTLVSHLPCTTNV